AAAKTFELTVQVPVPDMANLANDTIWPDVEAQVADLIETHNSTIVFANSRRLAERLTARPNEIPTERCGVVGTFPLAVPLAAHGWAVPPARLEEPPPAREGRPSQANPQVAGGAPAHMMGSGQTYGAPPVLARAHHGSVSKEQRAAVEEDLK